MAFYSVFWPADSDQAFCVTVGEELAIMADELSIGYPIEDNDCPSPGIHQCPVVQLGGEELHKPLPEPWLPCAGPVRAAAAAVRLG